MNKELRTLLTTEQSAALAAHDRSVSLAAGAGCGKTFVLTERYLSYLDPRQLEPSAELSELVALTFTDAAAREMRDRIRRRSYERWQSAEDPGERAAWKQLLATLDGARISTIHAFCGTLLRNHAAEAGVDPHFELLDTATTELLRLQTLDDHLRRLLVAGDERLISLATHFGLQNLRNHVAELLGKNVQEVLTRWIGATPEQLVAHWRLQYETQYAPAALSVLLAAEPVERLRKLCATAPVTTKKFLARAGEILDLLERFNASDNPQQAVQQLRDLAMMKGFCTAKDWDNTEEYEAFRDTCKAVRDGVLDKSFLRLPLVEETLHSTANIGLELLQLVAEVDERYSLLKQRRNVMEFDDLLARTAALLSDDRYPQVRENLSRATRLLMVDEFQDTDPQQVAIVKALRGDSWAEQGLFVVGDAKQSIYRFRGAEPRVSSELRENLPAESRLSLTTNFRSQPAILDFVNALFHDCFSEEYEPLVPHRQQSTPTPAIEFLWSLPDTPTGKQNKELARPEEARYIARRLAQLLDEGTPLVAENNDGTATTRPLQLGDIAILLRSLSDVAIYEAALREYGLDYYLAGGRAFYAQQEIHDVLHLLRTIASPVDELSLAGVLRSPIFAIEDETLFWLFEHGGSLSGGLFGADLPDELSPSERAKALRAAATLQMLREQKDRLLVAELLNKAIAATGYDAILLTEFLGRRKWANVQKLVEQARSLDRTRPGDLQGFVTQLSEFVVRTPREPLAATSTEGNVIRIMTIHNAKGLEFPLVVLPDLERRSNSGDYQPVFDQELGPLVKAVEKGSVVGWDMHQFAEQEQEREERKRLLYVACTRAADYLLLSSSIENLDKPSSDWMQLLGKRFGLADGDCLVELPAGYTPPEILVTTSEPKSTRKPAGPRGGADLRKMIEKTHHLAEAGKGNVPMEVAPIAIATQARRRFSISRLTGKIESPPRHTDDVELTPSHNAELTSQQGDRDAQPTTDVARGLGNLVHGVLEWLDFRQPTTDITGLCEFLAPRWFDIAKPQVIAEATELVRGFLSSERAQQLAAAGSVHREVEFLLPWPPTAQRQSFEQGAPSRSIHGYLDCLYQDESGNWHLLDYKTNHVESNHATPDGVRPLAGRYELQMFVYHLACQQALGAAPVECVLHFLRSGEEHSFHWDNAARDRVTEQIHQAIAAQLS